MDNSPKDDAKDWIRDRAAELLDSTRARTEPLFQKGQEALVRQARALRERARALNVREDPDEILGGSSLFQPFPESRITPSLHSLTWRGDALLGLSAFGALTLEDELSRVTRRIFHDDLPHQELSRRLFGTDFDAIHGYMDTVPGTSHRGGGILHRLQHGHDLEAAQQVYADHGLAGALVWTQHMIQDSATPTGVPLPSGARPLADLLVERELASRGEAALLVSFNIAELAAAFLAGAFALRLAALLPEIQRRKRIRKRLERAREAWECDDIDAVITHYQEARSLSDHQAPAIELALGWAYAVAERPMAEAFLAFRSAAEGLAADDRPFEMNGVAVSLRGTAYLLALSHATQILEFEDMQATWRGELTRMAQGAIASFESFAIVHDERFALEIGNEKVQFLRRPLSAAANYYLAARTAASSPFLSVASEITRLGPRAVASLGCVEPELVDPGEMSQVQDRWSAELAPVRIQVPEGS